MIMNIRGYSDDFLDKSVSTASRIMVDQKVPGLIANEWPRIFIIRFYSSKAEHPLLNYMSRGMGVRFVLGPIDGSE